MPDKQTNNSGDKEFLNEVQNVVSDFHAQKKTEAQKIEIAEKIKIIQNKARNKFHIMGICVLSFLILTLGIILFGPSGVFSKPQPWVQGGIMSSDNQIVPCVNRLWHMRYLVDIYYKAHNDFPLSLEDLAKVDFKREKLVCPLSGQPYHLEKIEDVNVFVCPSALAHNVVKVWMNLPNGPPVIERN